MSKKDLDSIHLFMVIIGILVLIISLFNCPYWYYTLVRIVTMLVAAYLAFRYCCKKRFLLALACLLIIAIFQPFYKLPIHRILWKVIDFALLFFWSYSVKLIDSSEKDANQEKRTDSDVADSAESTEPQLPPLPPVHKPRQICYNNEIWQVTGQRSFSEEEKSVIAYAEIVDGIGRSADNKPVLFIRLTTDARTYFKIMTTSSFQFGDRVDHRLDQLQLLTLYRYGQGEITVICPSSSLSYFENKRPTPIKSELDIESTESELQPTIDLEKIHIGWIKFQAIDGYGFIVDLVDNSEYFFHVSCLTVNPLPDDIVLFRIRKSKKHAGKYEAYSIAPPSYRKNDVLEIYNSMPDGIKEIIGLQIPSLLYSTNITHQHYVERLLYKYKMLIADLHSYVASFDIEAFINAYYVKTDFYNSASTRDWDWNILSYKGFVGEAYAKPESIYRSCCHYEESLVYEPFQVRQQSFGYNRFDAYLAHISSKSQEIKSTTAYGYDTSFWNDLDKEKIEAKIPEITDMWRAEIRKDYSKEEHMRQLVSQLRNRFAQLYDYTALFTYYDGGDATGVYVPHFDVKLTYTNGSIHIRTTAYANAKGYGYEVTHMLNGKKTTSEKRDLQVVDPDFIYLREYQKETRAKYMKRFDEIIEEYSNFD